MTACNYPHCCVVCGWGSAAAAVAILTGRLHRLLLMANTDHLKGQLCKSADIEHANAHLRKNNNSHHNYNSNNTGNNDSNHHHHNHHNGNNNSNNINSND